MGSSLHDDPEETPNTYEEAWAYCQREGVVFSIWTDPSGARSLLTATLRGDSASDLVKHGGADAWRAAVLGVARQLHHRQKTRKSEPPHKTEGPGSNRLKRRGF